MLCPYPPAVTRMTIEQSPKRPGGIAVDERLRVPGGSGTAHELPRRLGLVASTAIVIGTIIGSGIFRVPASVAGAVGVPADVAVVWILGGLITMCGALSIAELAAAFPRTGGVFVYLREAYGPLIAFLYGWTLLVVSPAGAAGIALVFAEYLNVVVPIGATGIRVVATVAIIIV